MLSDAKKLLCLFLVIEHIYKPANKELNDNYEKIKRSGFNIKYFYYQHSLFKDRFNRWTCFFVNKSNKNIKCTTPIMYCNGLQKKGKDKLGINYALNLQFNERHNPKNKAFIYTCKEIQNSLKKFLDKPECKFLNKDSSNNISINVNINYSKIKKFILHIRDENNEDIYWPNDPVLSPAEHHQNQYVRNILSKGTLLKCVLNIDSVYKTLNTCGLNISVENIKILKFGHLNYW